MRAIWITAVLAFPVATAAASIADEPVDESIYDIDESCVSLRDVRQTEILDARHILFRMRGGRTFINVTSYACDGMDRRSLIALEAGMGDRLCRLDKVAVVNGSNMGVTGRCELTRFEPLNETQVEAVQEAIAARARARKVPRVGRVTTPTAPPAAGGG